MKKYKDEFLFTFPSGTNIRNVWAYLKEKGLDVDYTMRGVIVKTFDGGSQAVTLINQSKDYGYSNIKQLHAKGTTIKSENAEMVLNNNKQISHHTKELASAVKGKKVPAWVVAKVNRSASDLSDATHYLEGSKYGKGGTMKGFCYTIGGL